MNDMQTARRSFMRAPQGEAPKLEDRASQRQSWDRLSIGSVADQFNISPRAIRFYEEQGLLSLARAGTHRKLGSRDRAALQRILQLRKMGFSVAEIRTFWNGGANPEPAGGVPDATMLKAHMERLLGRRRELDHAIALVQAELG